VLDLTLAEAFVVACLANRETLDGLATRYRAAARVAPDELWLIGPRAGRAETLTAVREQLGSRGLAVDQTDGWAVWTIEGDDRLEIVRRLMFTAVPDHRPAFVQGAITGVGGKVLYESGRLHLFVPSPVGHHLIDRIMSVGADLAPTIRPPAPLMPAGAGR
jgi:hypothetical protein